MATTATATDRQEQARTAARASWKRTTDRTARTAPARAALTARFLRLADGDAERAETLRLEHYARMRARSADSRRRHTRAAWPGDHCPQCQWSPATTTEPSGEQS